MELTTDYILPQELTGYVRAALADYNFNQFTLSRYLPNRTIQDIDYRVDRGGAGLADMGSFRTYDAESKVADRLSLSRIMGELPPISLKTRLSEYARLREKNVVDQQVVDAILNDARKLTRDTAARIEKARGDTLVTGTTPFAEFGAGFTVDWGRRGSHTVTAGTLWSNPSADIVSDLEAWCLVYETTNGVQPGSVLVSRQTLAYMMRNASVRNLVFPASSTQPTVVGLDRLNEAIMAFGLPDIEVYRSQVNVAGSATQVIPTNKLLLLPEEVAPDDYEGTQLGMTLWGQTLEAQEPGYGIEEADQPGIVAGAYKTQDPVAIWTKASAIGMPVLANPDLSFCATVA
jgi:hypothetical protein